ncbi:TonB-dependent receptor [Novosphingobium beihaiensis]|uniref:TonB-dependent receptor n=1 Tax=Novosphingobium beihaiensis TaxID=2930389 RepID=A0ABT0BTQ5_9SPHN|nr:TonB-dependent receptor [Novosphingobium beihaiensis]MCJ2188442.1 TonB-dependent receptor [Novosphingobium beihaiensis]
MRRHGVLLAGVSLLAFPGLACAEDAAGDAAPQAAQATDEIIVTAQKRSERLSDVPLSITAQTGQQLANQGVSSVSDLEKVAPGFTYQKSSYGYPVFAIRGIGFYDTAVALAPTVSVYVDQIPLAYSPMTSGASLDLARVEILKGPQGTLFGQNATGGAVNYIAAKPTDVLAFGGRFEYGRFNEANLEGYISGPIADGVKARLAVRRERRDDWQVSQTRPNDTLGRRNFQTGRFLLDLEPGNDLKIELSASGWRDKSDNQAVQYKGFAPSLPGGLAAAYQIPVVQPLAPHKARVADWNAGQDFRKDDWFYQLAARADLTLSDAITLTSITAYSRYRTHSPGDYDGTILDNFDILVDGRIRSFSQELRLAGNMGRVRWLIGGNYASDKTADNNDNILGAATNPIVGPFEFHHFTFDNNQRIKSKAVFGSLDYELTDTLTLQGALRYTNEHRRFTGCLYDPGDGLIADAFAFLSQQLTGNPVTLPPGSCITIKNNGVPDGVPVMNRLNEDNLSWRANLSWKPDAETLLYANVTKGYKAGSFPTIAGIFQDQYDGVTQESVLAYEAGFKVAPLGPQLQLSGAVFYYDYKNKQLLGIKPTLFGNTPALVNVPKSRVYGAELTVTARPVEGLNVSVGGTYVNSKVTDSFFSSDPYANIIDLKGEAFPNSPRWQLNGSADYEFPVSDTLDVYLGGNARYRSSTYAAFGEAPLFRMKGYALVDLRAGFADPDGRWRAGVWARNVTNQFYLIQAAHLVDTETWTTGMPATYGISVSFNY